MHINNKGKDIFIFGKGITQGLNNTTLAAETLYSINFTGPCITFSLSLIIMGTTVSYLLMLQIYQFKAKDSKIKKYSMCLGNISGDFSANNMKKNRITWVCVQFFC